MPPFLLNIPYLTIAKIVAMMLAIVFSMVLYRDNQSLKHDLHIVTDRLHTCSIDLTATTTALKTTIEQNNRDLLNLQTTAKRTAEANAQASAALTAEANRLRSSPKAKPIVIHSEPTARITAIEAAVEAHRALVTP